jgi:hypothetical protein
MIGRRRFITGATACLCGAQVVTAQSWPSGNGGLDTSGHGVGTPQAHDLLPIGGCNLRSEQAQKFARQYRISRECGEELSVSNRIQLEVAMNRFARIGRQHFGVRPIFGFYDDSASQNAFATPYEMFDDYSHPDGTVVFGSNLLNNQLRLGSLAPSAIMVILAHEHGHILQFKRNRGGACPDTELEADFLAGWALGVESTTASDLVIDPRVMAQKMFDFGDYNFNSPDTHGTPAQRAGAVIAGYRAGRNGMELNASYTTAIETNWRT